MACTTKIKNSIELELPSWSWEREGDFNILTHGILVKGKAHPLVEERFTLDPIIEQISCSLPKPTLDDNISDLSRFRRCICKDLNVYDEEIRVPYSLIQTLTQKLHENEWKIKTIISDISGNIDILDVLPDYEAKDYTVDKTGKNNKLYGLAIDIGTSTIAVYIIELTSGNELAVASVVNPQVQVGADIITRIRYTTQNDEGNLLLSNMLKNELNELISRLARDSNIDLERIVDIVVVGNPTMSLNLLGISISQLGTAPYIPAFNGGYYTTASEIGLNINPNGKVYVPPLVTGFLGADAVGTALVTNMLTGVSKDDDEPKIKLAMDIGTNSEILLSDSNRILACSAAAGPAFEGGNLQFGIRACPGAIYKIEIRNKKIKYSTIGGQRARGITGSGVVEGISEFLKVGAISRPGSIDRDTEKKWLKYPKRIKLTQATEPTTSCDLILPELRIVPRSESALNTTITITQNDIREVQLAKAAIRTGIEILMNDLGVTEDDLDVLYLAGAFGNYIKPIDAIEINLLPEVPLKKIRSVGNSAGTSAKIMLRNRDARKEMENIAGKIEYIDLAMHSKFQDLFIKNMEF